MENKKTYGSNDNKQIVLDGISLQLKKEV